MKFVTISDILSAYAEVFSIFQIIFARKRLFCLIFFYLLRIYLLIFGMNILPILLRIILDSYFCETYWAKVSDVQFLLIVSKWKRILIENTEAITRSRIIVIFFPKLNLANLYLNYNHRHIFNRNIRYGHFGAAMNRRVPIIVYPIYKLFMNLRRWLPAPTLRGGLNYFFIITYYLFFF